MERTPALAVQVQEDASKQKKLNPNYYLIDWLSDFIETLPIGAHVKETQTGKYILCNGYDIVALGLTSKEEKIGLTAYDLFSEHGVFFRGQYLKKNLTPAIAAWQEEELRKIADLERQVQATQRPIQVQCLQILSNGFIQLEQSVKFPIPDRDNKKIIAILTYATDLTSQCDLLHLFQHYRQYYPGPIAVELLSKYLEIDQYLYCLLTVREMQVLLALYQQLNRKKAARLLNISSNTLASHLQHLKELKLTKPDLNEVLMQIRKTLMNKSKKIILNKNL